jgi:ergothioneine biosynthesis protein EgtB
VINPQHLRTVASAGVDMATEPASLQTRYEAVRTASLAIAAPLSDEDCAIQSMPDASPVKWHLAHTSWFFETFVLAPHLSHYHAFNPAFRMLFNSYYNAVGEQHPRSQRGLISRPTRADVGAYRRHVDAGMLALLRSAQGVAGAVESLITLGLNHEQQHQELMLTDVLHMLSCNPLEPAYAPMDASPSKAPPPLTWVDYESALVEIGHDGPEFAFDNETPRHRQYLNRFALASRPVTNGDYLGFIADGGYRRPDLWLSAGWEWVNADRIEAPSYWRHDGGGWRQFTLHGSRAVDLAAPVCHVSLFEADAYARWAGARLPTEAEWEIAAAPCSIDGHFREHGMLRPLPATDRGSALMQLFGDVWQWTQSAYAPYPGYRTAPGAIGEYNGKFMANQYVLRGGSFATPKSHIRATYRNFFPATARWQFTGFRLARDA